MISLGDIVIGYHENDLEFVKKLVAKLGQRGLRVWYNQPGEDGKKTSEAILGCKVFLPILSEVSAVDKTIHEQLSLAYISNSAIYPIGRAYFGALAPKLNGGARLMLAKINWSFVTKDEHFEERTDTIIGCIQKDMQNMSSSPELSQDQTDGFIFTHGIRLPVIKSHLPDNVGTSTDQDYVAFSQAPDLTSISRDTPFWDRHFKGKTEVTWVEFRDKFLADYGKKIVEGFGEYEEERKNLFINLMYRDVFDHSKIIRHSVYEKFCGKMHPHAFFTGMQDYMMAYSSLREVLSMDSSLRISTIQNLGSFQFPAIVAGLSEMLEDEDPNIRAVATIALAHAGKERKSTVDKIVILLEDEDRLVRESACLSLGYLRSTRAVTHVVDRWRNDPISTVREAAELALSRMDAPDAVQCMKVTKVLSSEMNALKPESTRL